MACTDVWIHLAEELVRRHVFVVIGEGGDVSVSREHHPSVPTTTSVTIIGSGVCVMWLRYRLRPDNRASHVLAPSGSVMMVEFVGMGHTHTQGYNECMVRRGTSVQRSAEAAGRDDQV